MPARSHAPSARTTATVAGDLSQATGIDGKLGTVWPGDVAAEPAGDVVTFGTSDGVALRGRWHSHGDGRAVVIVVHGFSASIADPGVRRLVRHLVAGHLDVLCYDSRGHGRSGGRCAVGTEEHRDVAAAVAAARSQWAGPVVLVGVSMGAVAVAGYLAGASGPPADLAGAVLVSGPARWRVRCSAVGLATAVLTRTAVGRWVAARRLRVRVATRWWVGEAPESLLGRVRLPVAVVHGAEDRLLAPSHAERLRRAAAGPVRLDVVAGMAHGLDESCVRAVARATAWVLEAALVGVSVEQEP